ncbi:MAG TPA: hypothetical protein VNB24_05530 [Acidimicrobiales bacterium]|nr:hypothetical protein [Acidimicrobiales bacterium]
MRTVTYWLVVAALVAFTVASFRLMIVHGTSGLGVLGLIGTLVSVAVFMAYSLSMRDRDKSSPPIAR